MGGNSFRSTRPHIVAKLCLLRGLQNLHHLLKCFPCLESTANTSEDTARQKLEVPSLNVMKPVHWTACVFFNVVFCD